MAKVKIIWEGWFRWIEAKKIADVSGTSTYVESNDVRIVVDTPNTGEEEEYLAALAKAGIDREKIDFVVVTHEHPDHIGCMHLFPNATFVGWGARWRGSRHEYWQGERLDLAPDVYVLKTPGHTLTSVSVIAATPEGTVAMVGDMWWHVNEPNLRIILDKEALAVSRKRMLELADFIIPGHEGMRPVSEAVL